MKMLDRSFIQTLNCISPVLIKFRQVEYKINPCAGLVIPFGLHEVEGSRISIQSVHESGKVFQPYSPAAFTPQDDTPDTHFVWRLSQLQGHSAAGRKTSKKNLNDPIGNRTRHLLDGSAVQPTEPPNKFKDYNK
jgi:hypothetical protein